MSRTPSRRWQKASDSKLSASSEECVRSRPTETESEQARREPRDLRRSEAALRRRPSRFAAFSSSSPTSGFPPPRFPYTNPTWSSFRASVIRAGPSSFPRAPSPPSACRRRRVPLRHRVLARHRRDNHLLDRARPQRAGEQNHQGLPDLLCARQIRLHASSRVSGRGLLLPGFPAEAFGTYLVSYAALLAMACVSAAIIVGVCFKTEKRDFSSEATAEKPDL